MTTNVRQRKRLRKEAVGAYFKATYQKPGKRNSERFAELSRLDPSVYTIQLQSANVKSNCSAYSKNVKENASAYQ